MGMKHLAVLVIGLASVTSAHALVNAASSEHSPVSIDVKSGIAEQLRGVEAVIGSEHYSELAAEDIKAVRDALGRIRNHVGNHPSVEGLAPDIRTAVFNDQELVNTIMARAHADSRMVCERVRTIGSNRREQVCITAGQRRQMREDSEKVMRDTKVWNHKRPGEAG